jgi:hypothetical protein
VTKVFDPGAFNRLLDSSRPGLGQNVLWEPGYLCPCRSSTSGAAEQGCPVCKGRGVVWQAPVAAWTGLAGMKIVREWAAFGEWEGGDVVITVPSASPLYGLGEGDRITFVDSTEVFNVVLMGGVDMMTFQAASFSLCNWRDPTTKAIVVGGLPTQASDGRLTWTTGAPPAGVQYALKGTRHQRYFVFRDLVQDRHHSAGLALPKRVVLRLFDLFGR